MGTRIPTVFLIALFHTTSVGAQQDQCLELVRLSRMKTQRIMSQSQFASTVNAYCEERSNSSSAAVSAGGAGYSASASRAEASYGKFCSRDTDDRGSESDYNEYMEGVQPGAYAAYAACTAARNNDGVQLEMSNAPTRDRLVLGIYNRTDTGDTADMQWDGSDPVTCQWAGDAGGRLGGRFKPTKGRFWSVGGAVSTRSRCGSRTRWMSLGPTVGTLRCSTSRGRSMGRTTAPCRR